ncbi:MAG: N-acetylmuramoyl-L-alanine amidase [Clostridia bacterium]|nr:N-acetylmuramoyl-L-alanine amidase [Clostridia bacterium]
MAKIYIDQGHNPRNPNAGAEGNGYREQDLVYVIGVETANLLRQQGQEVRLSRPTAETQLGTSNASSLAARVNDANTWGADYFISLHANASVDPNASGSEAYIFSRGGESEALAESILTNLSESTGLANRGVFVRPSLYVLRRTRMPATLIELGFITNPADSALMANDPILFATGVANGVLEYIYG